jgi:UDP-glucose 4-epimerase
MTKKCVVTGGAGFIGSHIVDKLISLNYSVIVIDNESSECNENYYYNKLAKNFKFDICDYKNTRELYENVDYVFHLAAESRLQPAIENPINAFYKNTIGSCTVLQCAREAKVKKVIYSSTSSAYGGNIPPNKETDSNDCLNPYSLSKVTGEELCKLYTKLYGLNTIIFRYFNVYGERGPTTGQYSPVVSLFLKQKYNNQPLTIVGDGNQKRDFINVKDVVNVNLLASEINLENSQYGQIYNVGSGENISIIELANLISKNKKYLPPRIGEAKTTLANIDKTKKTFNWAPTINIKDWINQQNY